MKLQQIITLISLFFLFIRCDYYDNRLQIINHSKREKVLSIGIIGQGTFSENFGILTCKEVDSSFYANRVFKDFDTLRWGLQGKANWEDLEKKDTVVVYAFDVLLFEQYCKDSIPYNNCYRILKYAKEDLIKTNWQIIIDR